MKRMLLPVRRPGRLPDSRVPLCIGVVAKVVSQERRDLGAVVPHDRDPFRAGEGELGSIGSPRRLAALAQHRLSTVAGGVSRETQGDLLGVACPLLSVPYTHVIYPTGFRADPVRSCSPSPVEQSGREAASSRRRSPGR